MLDALAQHLDEVLRKHVVPQVLHFHVGVGGLTSRSLAAFPSERMPKHCAKRRHIGRHYMKPYWRQVQHLRPAILRLALKG